MRILIFSICLVLLSCGTDQKTESTTTENTSTTSASTTSDVPSISTETTEPVPPAEPVEPVDVTKLNYKKTAKNSEFAVYKTTSVLDGKREYYFKTLDGISLKFEVPLEGKYEAIIPSNLLERAKYQTGPAGANFFTVGKVFEVIYNKDNGLAELKLAKEEGQ